MNPGQKKQILKRMGTYPRKHNEPWTKQADPENHLELALENTTSTPEEKNKNTFNKKAGENQTQHIFKPDPRSQAPLKVSGFVTKPAGHSWVRRNLLSQLGCGQTSFSGMQRRTSANPKPLDGPWPTEKFLAKPMVVQRRKDQNGKTKFQKVTKVRNRNSGGEL